ncbi:MAG: hypothetical protein IT306_29545 [Chloroflexi bacterium]|nr:hypothetical protein [Chloroflexota bacterium]
MGEPRMPMDQHGATLTLGEKIIGHGEVTGVRFPIGICNGCGGRVVNVETGEGHGSHDRPAEPREPATAAGPLPTRIQYAHGGGRFHRGTHLLADYFDRETGDLIERAFEAEARAAAPSALDEYMLASAVRSASAIMERERPTDWANFMGGEGTIAAKMAGGRFGHLILAEYARLSAQATEETAAPAPWPGDFSPDDERDGGHSER